MATTNPIIFKSPVPSTSMNFTGPTIPLTYKDNTTTSENVYVYTSISHNITITGLDGRATITNNGTKSVTATFDVSSAVSSLQDFNIQLEKNNEILNYQGIHAHYGTTVTGILTLAYKYIDIDGADAIGTNYIFIESDADALPLFATNTTLWNDIYSYQVLNVLMANYSSDTIGTGFLYTCYSFNQPLTIPSGVTSIGDSFLSTCTSFNQPLTILSGVTSIGNSFLYNCYSFNQPLTIPSGVTSIGATFLSNCYSFNQPLTISGVTSISINFLSACYSFNQPLTISGVTSIGASFLYQCYSFNQPLTIPSGVTSIGNSFLSSCYSFNQPLTIPSGVTSIGTNFLFACYSFNQPLTIPSGVTSIGVNFLNSCYALSTIRWNTSTYPTDNGSLSQTVNSKPAGEGIRVYGTERVGLLAALPDRLSTPFRKLVNGGSD